MNPNQLVAQFTNQTLWSTDLFFPKYKAGEIGSWKILAGGGLTYDCGYYTGSCLTEKLPILIRKVETKDGNSDWETWMSLSPHEIESQEIGCRNAFGHTVIMGLGMGWVAANTALSPDVTKVTIVEFDECVIDLFHHSGAFETLPEEAQKKIVIVQGDAMKWKPEEGDKVDFLYADIWLSLAEPETLNQVRQMQKNIQAEKVYYWGQEIAIHAAVRQLHEESLVLTDTIIQSVTDQLIQLPLFLPSDGSYPAIVEQVVQNRMKRKLTVDVTF